MAFLPSSRRYRLTFGLTVLLWLKFLKHNLEIIHFKIAHLDLRQNELANSIHEGPSSEANTFSADL